jgi:hypothetical protein
VCSHPPSSPLEGTGCEYSGGSMATPLDAERGLSIHNPLYFPKGGCEYSGRGGCIFISPGTPTGCICFPLRGSKATFGEGVTHSPLGDFQRKVRQVSVSTRFRHGECLEKNESFFLFFLCSLTRIF